MPDSLFKEFQFQYPFRRYQQQILDRIDLSSFKDQQFHIVAPPGSGKTVVGIELVKRLAQPAVIFTPNTTIQLQWKKQVELFLIPDKRYLIKDIVSTNPNELKLINVFTYQLISTADQDNDFLLNEALESWQLELIENRTTTTLIEAKKRILSLKQLNPKQFSQEITKYKKIAKNNFLQNPSVKIETILHRNAQQLISRLVDHGVKVIVLDEVHHLLDYWAITIKYLSRRIEKPHLIGLTATPPHSASTQEKENYLSLMGEIDYQIPTPAVVKEGNLAPYQDLLYLCEPTPSEKTFLHNIQQNFETFINQLASQPVFNEFITSELNQSNTESSWRLYFKNHPNLAVAVVKYLTSKKITIPAYVIIIPEMKKDLTLDDWSVLLKRLSINYLKLSSNPNHQTVLENIKATLRMFGYVITEGGIKNHRSPTDLILSFSQAKHLAVLEILKTEIANLNNQIRAVIITDFEKMNVTAFKKVKNVLDPQAGGAVGIFNAVVHEPTTTKLEPILITGTSVLVDADKLPAILKAMYIWQDLHHYDLGIVQENTEFPKIIHIYGTGPDWSTNVYVQMITDLFEQGTIRCLIGTRGLIGEGWNSLRLNTLIDLTTVTTFTSTNQIRGRALRLDPTSPHKLANIWYIACLDINYEKGDQDLKRIIDKHKHFYGINDQGKIVKGATHIDENLMVTLITKGFKHLLQDIHNQVMLKKSSQRDQVFQQWKIGQPFQNIELSGISINKKNINIKTAHTIKDTATAITLTTLESIVGLSIWYIQNSYQILKFPLISLISFKIQQIITVLFIIIIQAHAGYRFKTLYHKVMTQIPVDAYISDITQAAVACLKELKMISPNINIKNIDVYSGTKGRIHIEMKDVDRESSQMINQVLNDLFSPVTDQRYLVSRSLNRLPLGILSPLWWLGYTLLQLLNHTRPTYHPVPDIIAVNKKKARIFAKSWKKYVGGGKLVYTRSEKGSRLLLKLRQYNHHEFEKMTYETWQ